MNDAPKQPQPTEAQAREGMNAMYKWTRHVYDATRKYYLLGRDHLIQNLNPSDNKAVIEVGCGTARNLIKMAKHYPKASFYGLDASDEMLKTAQGNLKSHKLNDAIKVQQGFAQSFKPESLFDLESSPHKIVFSYALSIIPPWKDSIAHAINLLPTGGEIHVIDFGGQDALPKPFRAFLFWWLKMFHVYYKPEILDHLKTLEKNGAGTLRLNHLYRGYAYYAVFKKF